ncbi:MAG: hypothetical protein GEU79_04505 [Acidimicrobiia bacterium]|nr:hypothetical protein [Acidimicrobiia bacterium]
MVAAVPSFLGGRLGLPSDDWGDRLEFLANMDADGASRVLLVSKEPDGLPGEVRSGPGFFYRVVETPRVNFDELWLPNPAEGDAQLGDFLEVMATGAILRPGAELADFGIEWVVTSRGAEEAEHPLSVPLQTQVDLVRIPMEDETLQVFRNSTSASVVASDWYFDGTGYSGTEVERIRLASNSDPSWSPGFTEEGWAMTLSGVEGQIEYGIDWGTRSVVWLGWLIIAAGVVLRGVFRDQVMGRAE